MLRWIAKFLLFRVLGGRALAALAVFGFIRRMLAGRRAAITRTGPGPEYPPSPSASAGESTPRSGSTLGR
jgi:hypothetical protein